MLLRGLEYVYAVRDHLGTNRLFFRDNVLVSSSDIVSVHANYPFGMDLRQANNVNPEFKYGFGGKEELELTSYWQFGERCLNPTIGRWINPDPGANDPSNIAWSPFCAMWSNPINVIDPTSAFNEYIGTIDEHGDVSYEQTGNKGGDETDYITYVDADGNQIDNVTVQVQTVNIAYGEMYQGSIDRIPGLNILSIQALVEQFHQCRPQLITYLQVVQQRSLWAYFGYWPQAKRKRKSTTQIPNFYVATRNKPRLQWEKVFTGLYTVT